LKRNVEKDFQEEISSLTRKEYGTTGKKVEKTPKNESQELVYKSKTERGNIASRRGSYVSCLLTGP